MSRAEDLSGADDFSRTGSVINGFWHGHDPQNRAFRIPEGYGTQALPSPCLQGLVPLPLTHRS